MIFKTVTDLDRIKVLTNEIAYIQHEITPEDCGHLHTTVSTLEHRITQISKELEERLSRNG